jgi:hypothetical protein
MREKPKLTFFPLPMRAWLEVVADLAADEERALHRLVVRYAEKGFLPLDDHDLANIAGVTTRTWLKRLKPRLQLKFPQEGWRWPEIDQQIERRQLIAGKRSLAGTKGNYFRWPPDAAHRNRVKKH